jgi:hypothetical protein
MHIEVHFLKKNAFWGAFLKKINKRNPPDSIERNRADKSIKSNF